MGERPTTRGTSAGGTMSVSTRKDYSDGVQAEHQRESNITGLADLRLAVQKLR